ncbi:MAG TPA: acetyl-CoA hydrolase/transferase C-terminal domain-containing protein [Caldimonas sp.]|nr:acetyl-CoA hydrolase/transferase C-terminal domain-containing protein [Caldimonas sp.]HEX2540154.1 acetyl-CoA hydrolase/transferase C-terminal domain-containing protein [Caldimonas sp.]
MIRLDPAQLQLRDWIRPGDGIVMGQGTAEPLTLTEALVRQRRELGGVRAFLAAMFSDTFLPGGVDGIELTGMGGVGTNRRLIQAGALDVIPGHVSQNVAFIADGTIACDVALVQVSPPDEHGRYSLGLGADHSRAAVDKARVVIAEMNRLVPQTTCDVALTEADIDVLVETSRPPIQLPSAPIGELERRIAAHVDAYIPDRATLQVGFGAIPEAIIAMLSNRRDLGMHSGMVGDSLVDLVESGALTNACKGIDVGVSITGVLFGTDDRLYRHAHRNPALKVCPIDYTHAADVLARLPRYVSINSALEVDLTGQVNAESIGGDYIGAVGGQVDFVRAARRSPGGASIIALPSAARRGTLSRIVGRLSGPVTTARSDVDIVATENGAVRLRGLPFKARVKAMIELAAPQHREALSREAHELHGA